MKHLTKKDKKRLKVMRLLRKIDDGFIDWIDTRAEVDISTALIDVFYDSLHGKRFLKMEWKYKYEGDL